MQETTHTYTITASLHALAARYRALAVEADLRALMAIRTDPEKIERTEEAFRALIVLQARHLKHARRIEKSLKVAQ